MKYYESGLKYIGKRERLDKYLNDEIFPEISRNKIQILIKEEKIKVNSKPVKNNYKLSEDDEISYDFSVNELDRLEPVDLGIEIIYEDSDIVVVNKPRGIVVHPASSVKDPTVINDLIYKNIELAPVSNERPGVVHRIDRYTSGIVLFVKHIEAYNRFVNMFKEKKLIKKYIALCYNNFKFEKGIIDMPIARNPRDRKKMCVKPDGKASVTYYYEKHRFDKYSLVELDLKTGRTHQIRVHLAQVGHPVVGDGVYGPEKNEFDLTGQFLHAGFLSFIHPFTEKEITLEVPLPKELQEILRSLDYEKEI